MLFSSKKAFPMSMLILTIVFYYDKFSFFCRVGYVMSYIMPLKYENMYNATPV